jgi:hypothetical protein
MGSFYTNVTLRSSDKDRIAKAIEAKRWSAYITDLPGPYTLVFDRASEDQDGKVIDAAAAHLTASLGCAALAVVNHDDDLLWYGLYEKGKLTDTYTSAPGYFEGDDSPPEGGNAEDLCRVFGADGQVDVVEAALRAPSGSEDGYVFAMERHQALVEALGLPAIAVGGGFNYIEEGELPEGLTSEQLRRVG